MITYLTFNPELHVLTAEGLGIVQSGSHEFIVWKALPSASADPITSKQLEELVGKDVAKIGQGKAMKNKWISKKGDGFVKAVRAIEWFVGERALTFNLEQVDEVVDSAKNDLVQVQTSGSHTDEKLLADLRKRKLVEKK